MAINQFELWKLASDALLILSLIYLCIRFVKSSGPAINTREIRDLEIILRNLIKDADVAGRALSDSLTRRQHSLEGLLSDLDSAERRVSQSLTSTPSSSTPPASRRRVEVEPMVAEEEILPPVAPRRTGAAAYSASVKVEAVVAKPAKPRTQSKQKYNIFGEPIGESAEAPALPRQLLANEIEIERTESSNPQASSQAMADLDRVYEAAEKLLKSGQKLESVAHETQLPMDEVRALSQMMAREEHAKRTSDSPLASSITVEGKLQAQPKNEVVVQDDSEAEQKPRESAEDPRLGVLGTMRREIQVL